MVIDKISLFNQILILLLGLVTSFTDITEKKIKNIHLLIIGAVAIVFILIEARQHQDVIWNVLLNGAVALVIGLLLFISSMWRGGDVKLFLLYSLLMKPTGDESVFLASPIVLFISTFIIAFIIILPFELYTAFGPNRASLQSKKDYWNNVKFSFLGFSSFNWVLFPLLHKLGLFKYPIAVGVFLTVLFPIINRAVMNWLTERLIHWKWAVILLFAAGFILHLSFIPRELLGITLVKSLKSILLFSLILFFFKSAMDNAGTSKERVPFAPMLMIGYYLSYTGFLKTIESWMVLIR